MQQKLDGRLSRSTVAIVFSLDAQVFLGENSKQNVQAAHQYCLTHPVDIIVFTGGIFNWDKGQVLAAGKMMAKYWYELGSFPGYPSVVAEGESKTTRQNIANTVELLSRHGYELPDCDVIVVSERYHLLGIRLLFLLLHHKWTSAAVSKFRITNREKLERLIRLPLYILDPRGTGWLSRRKIKQRGG